MFQEPYGCEICREGLSVLFKDWTSPKQINSEQQVLIVDTCPHMPDPNKCSEGVESWWEKLAEIIFSDEAGFHYCNAMNANCTLSQVK